MLVYHLQKYTGLHCKLADSGEKIERGVIYVAWPDCHLLIKDDSILITHGPHENLWRPSIDVLFRSAAASYGPHAIGIILTGMLDDGVSGMSAIKRSDGTVIVQDPDEAEFSDMPANVLNNIQVDHCAHLSEIGYILKDILSKTSTGKTAIPNDVLVEAKIAERLAIGIDQVKELGAAQTPYTCPDCGGILFEIHNGNLQRFRCYTGHSFTGNSLVERQNEAMEESLWFCIRIMEERKNLLSRLEEEDRKKGLSQLAENHRQRLEEIKIHIERLKDLLFKSPGSGSPGIK